MTKKELQNRQLWSLEQKIDHAVGTVEAFVSRTGRVPYVSFSGGKDSTVLLDLCRRFIKPDMVAVFDNTGLEFPEIVKFVSTFENVITISPKLNIKNIIFQYGFPLISKEIAQYVRQIKTTKSEKLLQLRLNGKKSSNGRVRFALPLKWRFLINEPFMISEQCCDILKKRPFEKFNRYSGMAPIIGIMAAESCLRMNQYIRRGGCNSFAENHVASYPLSIWTEKDIWDYIKKFNVPICNLYRDYGCSRTGCMFCGFGAHLESSRFDVLYDLHPKIYNIIMGYQNNGVSYREALRKIGVSLPDEVRQLKLPFEL